MRGVVALSTANVWAVRDYSPGGHHLVIQWNGTSWSVPPSPHMLNTASILGAVSADSTASIWTAGLDINKHDFMYHTLIEHYC